MNEFEISLQELSKLDIDDYYLIDIRDKISSSYGYIPEALISLMTSCTLIMTSILIKE